MSSGGLGDKENNTVHLTRPAGTGFLRVGKLKVPTRTHYLGGRASIRTTRNP
jgi:hypothetical protein